MTSTLLPMAAFELLNSPECKVTSRSFRDALAAGLALSAAAVPDCSACIAKCAASLSSLALSVPPLLRDASISSTPSPSDRDSGCSSPRRSRTCSASLSPFELLQLDEDDSDSDSWSNVSPCAWSGTTSFLRSAVPSAAALLPPLDLCSHVRELDESEFADGRREGLRRPRTRTMAARATVEMASRVVRTRCSARRCTSSAIRWRPLPDRP